MLVYIPVSVRMDKFLISLAPLTNLWVHRFTPRHLQVLVTCLLIEDATDANAALQDLTFLFHSRIKDLEIALHRHTISSVSGAQLQAVKALSADYVQLKLLQ